ncbi:hypothetical protein [Aliarcobacter butzleri]|uniref:hypothetical protein n=1 Tax=Aliarcobacter butzleri TaxID=28197 RepID=UPI0024DE301B|nr:hypothetical protein [Aliarcobacter butzleri]MDK2046964.1 hypothetical protein [Aliarcobacter butzleri]
MKNSLVFIYILLLVVAIELVIDFLSLIRLAQLYDTMRITRFFSLIPISFIILYLIINLFKLKFNYFSLFLMIILYVSLVNSLFLWQDESDLRYSYYYIFSEATTIIFAFFCFIFVYNIYFTSDNLKIIEKYLIKVSYIILYVSSLILLIAYFLSYIYPNFYFSVSGKILLIPATMFLLKDKLKMYFYTIGIIVLGGKLGVLISVLISSIFILKFKFKISNLIFLFTFICLTLFVTLLLYIIKDISNIGIIYKINANYNIWNIDIENIKNFGGGRLIELISVFKHFSLSDYLLGKGIGFEYLNIENENEFIHNVHMTPFGLISKFGILLTFCMYILIFYYLFKKNNSKNVILNVFFKSIIIGILFFSLTEYSFFVNLILWMSLGYLASVNRSKLCAES